MSFSRVLVPAVLVAIVTAPLASASAFTVGLAGTEAKMIRQHAVAVEEKFTFSRTPLDVTHLVAEGKLVPVVPGAGFTLSGVSFAYTRPEVRSFIEHFSADYLAATGTGLVVTSLTRPITLQPRNAHILSVHPAGMAVDFRVPSTDSGRVWLESSLLAMERQGLLDVTRERRPAHYHVAVFPEAYRPYAAKLDSTRTALQTSLAAARAAAASAARHLVPASPSEDAGPLSGILLGVLLLQAATAALVLRARQRDVAAVSSVHQPDVRTPRHD